MAALRLLRQSVHYIRRHVPLFLVLSFEFRAKRKSSVAARRLNPGAYLRLPPRVPPFKPKLKGSLKAFLPSTRSPSERIMRSRPGARSQADKRNSSSNSSIFGCGIKSFIFSFVISALIVIVIIQNILIVSPGGFRGIVGSGVDDNDDLQASVKAQSKAIAELKARVEEQSASLDIMSRNLEKLRADAGSVHAKTPQQEHTDKAPPGQPQKLARNVKEARGQNQPTLPLNQDTARSRTSEENDFYFTIGYAPCKNDDVSSSVPKLAGICRAPDPLPKEQCAINKVPGVETYGTDLVSSISMSPHWTKLQDEHGDRTVHINTHDPIKEDIYISKSIHERGTWDDYILNIFKHAFKPVPVEERASKLVVDVGGNIGYFSLTAAAYGFRTVTFEPMRFNLERMISSIERNPGFSERMKVYNMAVSNSHGALSLKPTSATNAGNFAVQSRPHTMSEGLYGVDYVNSASLDEFLDEDVIVVKIDVETFEPFVLDGARRLLCHNIVPTVIIEFDKNQRTAHGGACPPDKMMSWMDKLGYDARDVIIGSKKIDLKTFDPHKMPPNVWFSLRDDSTTPAKRLSASKNTDDDVCGA